MAHLKYILSIAFCAVKNDFYTLIYTKKQNTKIIKDIKVTLAFLKRAAVFDKFFESFC
jgi:hypothetical protein